nr:MAG: hypothetical protein [Microvirus Sku119]
MLRKIIKKIRDAVSLIFFVIFLKKFDKVCKMRYIIYIKEIGDGNNGKCERFKRYVFR